MNIDEFNKAYDSLSNTERKVLYRLMQNKSDDDLSSSMRITKEAGITSYYCVLRSFIGSMYGS